MRPTQGKDVNIELWSTLHYLKMLEKWHDHEKALVNIRGEKEHIPIWTRW